MQVLGLVALTCGACAHIVLDHSTQVRRVEVAAEALECALDSFVAVIVNGSEEFLEKGGARRDVEAPLERDQPVDEGLGSRMLGGTDLLLDGDQCGVLKMSLSQALDEVKTRS